MFIVGLTGGIGSGKSVVGNLFRANGIKVVDADQGSREVVKPGLPALSQISSWFGAEFILDDGTLNRPLLRNEIFNNAKSRDRLENLLHPLIKDWTNRELETAISPYAILESPLLLEMGQNAQVDRVLVVDIPRQLQIKRASSRDNSTPNQIQAIINTQMSREQRLSLADDVIDNTCSLDDLQKKVAELHLTYLDMANTAR